MWGNVLGFLGLKFLKSFFKDFSAVYKEDRTQNYEPPRTGRTFYRVGQKTAHGVYGNNFTLSTLNHFHNFWHTYTTGNLKVDGA